MHKRKIYIRCKQDPILFFARRAVTTLGFPKPFADYYFGTDVNSQTFRNSECIPIGYVPLTYPNPYGKPNTWRNKLLAFVQSREPALALHASRILSPNGYAPEEFEMNKVLSGTMYGVKS
jgi:hypothetical protein